MAIYKNDKKLTRLQIKNEIKQIQGWSETRYKKELQTIRKGLQRYGGKETSASEFLYKEAKAQKRYKDKYVATQYVKDVRQLARAKKSKRTIVTTRGQILRIKTQSVKTRFGALIETNEKAREIYNAIKDPYKRDKALSDYANKLHTKIDESEKVIESEAIPFSSQVYGSDTTIDFDIDAYL